MAFLSLKRASITSMIMLTLSACSENSDADRDELIFRGQNYPDNVLIIRNGYYYFGDDATIPPNLAKMYQNGDNCIDVGLIAFSLNANIAQCGNYSFSYTKGENGNIEARGTCVRTDARKCYPDKASPTSVEYVLTESEMPHRFRFYVRGMFDDTFQLDDSK